MHTNPHLDSTSSIAKMKSEIIVRNGSDNESRVQYPMQTTLKIFASILFVLFFMSGVVAEENPATEVVRGGRVTYKADALTFRILASRVYKEDAEIIERGEKTADRDIMDSTGKILLARWVPVAESEKDSFKDKDMVVREKGKTLEVLVKYNDGADITGEYLTYVGRGMGPQENPGIAFNFNAVGANKFLRLTGANLPDPADSKLKRHMGIIINGSLYCAPNIIGRIQGSGIITFSRRDTEEERKKLSREIDDLIGILHAVALPPEK
jgi:hypothetical protein